MAEKKIVYVGKDGQFWSGLQKKVREYCPYEKFSFEQMYGKGNDIFYVCFMKIMQSPPSIIYLDFSLDPVECAYLGKLLREEGALQHIPVVGILDYLGSADLILKCLGVGIYLCHIKSGEFSNIVFQPVELALPGRIKFAEFATAKAQRSLSLGELVRVGHVTQEYIQIEANSKLENGEKIVLEQNIFEKKILPYNYYEILDVDDKNLYYKSLYRAHARFLFENKEEPVPEDDEESTQEKDSQKDLDETEEEKGPEKAQEEETDEERAKREEELALKEERREAAIERLKKWVKDNDSREFAKDVKIVVIDSMLQVFAPPSISLQEVPYFFRVRTGLRDSLKELKRYFSNIICYQLEDSKEYQKRRKKYLAEQEKLLKEEKIKKIIAPPERKFFNNIENLSKVVTAIKNIDGHDPFIIVFGGKWKDSEELKEKIGHRAMVAAKGKFNVETIFAMGAKVSATLKEKEDERLQAKLNELKKENYNKYARKGIDFLREKEVYFKDSDERSFAYFTQEVILIEMNEMEIVFQSERELPFYVCFLMTSPVKFFVTTVPLAPNHSRIRLKSGHLNRAFIHSIGEQEKNELRKEINASYKENSDDKETGKGARKA